MYGLGQSDIESQITLQSRQIEAEFGSGTASPGLPAGNEVEQLVHGMPSAQDFGWGEGGPWGGGGGSQQSSRNGKKQQGSIKTWLILGGLVYFFFLR